MERRRAFDTHNDHTRPDRSRSPHQSHPWEKNCSETKSVLYSADVQFHRRSPNKQRSPSKQSSSKASQKSSKIPLKQSQPERARTTSHPQARIDAGVQDYVEKLQKWSSMHSPSKFMAGMMSADGTYAVPLEATPKRRSRGPWFVEHYSKGPSQAGTEKSQGSKDNIIRIEKENRRTDEYLTSKLKDNEVIHSEKSVNSTTTTLVKSSNQVVETDDDGYAIPTTEGRTGPMPSFQERETPIFATPSKVESPNEFFYTPLTHPRSHRTPSGHAATPDPKLRDTPLGQVPEFSLINVKKFSSTSPSKHDTSIKERTETQLASFEKASKRLDKALQEAAEVLENPIKLTLPSDIPPFSDQRQTLDVAQVENLRNRDVAARGNLRHSLPSKPLFENSSSYEHGTTDVLEESTKKAHFVFSGEEEKASEQLRSSNIPLSKVLGASMAAELAYAEKVQKIQTHLNNAHHLATLVHQEAKQQLIRDDTGDDIDRILDSISLRDDSLVTSDDSEKPKKDMYRRLHGVRWAEHLQTSERVGDLSNLYCKMSANAPPNMHRGDDDIEVALPRSYLGALACKPLSLSSKVQGTTKPMNTSVRFNFMSSPVRKAAFMTPAQRHERKAKVEEYLRMYNVLHTLQTAVFKLKRSKCIPEQVPKIEELSRVAEKEYKEAIIQAKSWLRKKISQHEFLQIVERQQKKVYDESEECSNRIKRLLSAQAATQNTRQEAPKNLTIPTTANENELPPVRMDTRALNESVECDLWNLSARSLRRNLDIRREQAEILNRSFEEKTKDIEQMTKKSITAQIIQYDRVISERTELINKLDEISAEEEVSQPTPTPRRAGVEPLDLAQLEEHAIEDERNNISVSESGGNQQSSLSEDSTDVGIIRTISQSTVYEDSLSHFDEEEKNQSSASSFTLYQSDVDDALETKSNENAELHSRRTLDTAETLAMLSRQAVTIVGDENSLDSVDQILHGLTESATFTLKDATIEEVSSEPTASPDNGKPLNTTFTIADTGPMLSNAPSEEADQSMNVIDGMGDVLSTPYESVRLEVSMSNTGTWSKAEVNVPDNSVTHVSEVLDAPTLETPSFIESAVDEIEVAELGDSNLNSLERHEEIKEDSKEEKENEFFESDAEGSGDRIETKPDTDVPSSTLDELRPGSRNDFNDERYEVETNKEVTEAVDENGIHEVEDETQLSSQSDTTANTGLANEMTEATEVTATEEDVLNAVESTSVIDEKENSAQRSSGTDSAQDDDASLVEDKNVAESQEQEKLVSGGAGEVEVKSEEKREKDAYELSFIDGRVSMGLNRSELCDNLSSSILQSLLDSPRRRSLPRYTLNDSLLNDSVLATPKSPRAPKERFNTKMPGSSPRLLDDSLKLDLADIVVDDLVTSAVDDIDDLKESADRLSFSSKEETIPKPVQNLFEQLDDTYEDLLSIEKPTSSLHTVLSPTDRTPGFPQLVADTPRKEPPQPSAEDAKENRLTELNQILESNKWMKAKCQQLVKPLWSRICAKGCILSLYDDFVAVPVVPEEISLEGEDEQLIVENKTFLIWATMIELASKLWPESQTEKTRLSSKMLPIPKSEEEFSEKAICYVLEQLSEMPPSHRYNRISRPPPPPYADTSVDKAVGRHVYQEDPYSFGREVDKEYRKLCEEIIEQVGDRFVSAEVQVLQHRLVASDIDTTPSSAMISGDYGRPSLNRLSLSSRASIGSLPSKSPLRIVPEVYEV